jgi:hypothetical protein
MAKLIGPLMSFGASGQIGKAMVTGSWRGIPYARQYVVGANPRTTAQQENRFRFRTLGEMWRFMPAPVVDAFNLFANGRRFTGVNAFIGQNNRLLVGQTDLANMVFSPGARGGLPPVAITVSQGAAAGELDIAILPPDALPVGWTITAARFLALPDQDPTNAFSGTVVAGSDASDPYEVTLSGLPDGADCVGAAWFEYERADGRTAYSISLADIAPAGV